MISPIHARARTGKWDPLCLHSTPVMQRKFLEKLPEATGLSPLSVGKCRNGRKATSFFKDEALDYVVNVLGL